MVWPHVAFWNSSIKSLYARIISGSPITKFKLIWSAKILPKFKSFYGRLSGGGCLRLIRFISGMALGLCTMPYTLIWNTLIIYSSAVCWPRWSGAVSTPGYKCLGPQIRLMNSVCSLPIFRVSLRDYPGLVWGLFAGPFGLLGTNSLLRVFSLTILLKMFISLQH